MYSRNINKKHHSLPARITDRVGTGGVKVSKPGKLVKTRRMKRMVLYGIHVTSKIADRPYVIVYFDAEASWLSTRKFKWLQKTYKLLPRKYKKNIKKLYLVHPSKMQRAFVWFSKPFVSKKFWKKFTFVHTLQDLDTRVRIACNIDYTALKDALPGGNLIDVPEFVLEQDAKNGHEQYVAARRGVFLPDKAGEKSSANQGNDDSEEASSHQTRRSLSKRERFLSQKRNSSDAIFSTGDSTRRASELPDSLRPSSHDGRLSISRASGAYATADAAMEKATAASGAAAAAGGDAMMPAAARMSSTSIISDPQASRQRSRSFGGRASTRMIGAAVTPRLNVLGGAPLSLLVQSSPFGVPELVVVCADFLHEHATGVEGVFRVPGNADDIAFYKNLCMGETIQLGPPASSSRPISDADVHVAASLMKKFFRDLPKPLLTAQAYVKMAHASSSTKELGDLADQIKQTLEAELPKENYDTLAYLMVFLDVMSKHSDKTKMEVKNLALVWAPNLLHGDLDASTIVESCDASFEAALGMMLGLPVAIRLTLCMITFADYIFPLDKLATVAPPGVRQPHGLDNDYDDDYDPFIDSDYSSSSEGEEDDEAVVTRDASASVDCVAMGRRGNHNHANRRARMVFHRGQGGALFSDFNELLKANAGSDASSADPKVDEDAEVDVAGSDTINPILSQETQDALKKASTRFRGSSSGLIREI